jgi:hypothetical protein
VKSLLFSFVLLSALLARPIHAQKSARPMPIVIVGPKPQVDTKNPDGSPAYKTYEDYVEALSGWKVRQVLASLGHMPAVQIKEQPASRSDIDALEKKIAKLETRVSFDEYMLGNKQEQQNEVTLNPASTNVYQRLDSGPLSFLISLQSVTPYLNGYKAAIDVGNPSTAHFKGVTIKYKWSKPYDWNKYSVDSYKAWQSAVHTSEISVQNDISPGSWNPVEIVLIPASRDELGYFTISIESNTVSLNNN